MVELWVSSDYEHHLRHAYRDVVNLPVGGLTLGNCCWVVAFGAQPKHPSYEREQCHKNLPFLSCPLVEVLQFGGESLHLNKKLIYISYLYKKVNTCDNVTDEKISSYYIVSGDVYGRI